MAGVDLAVIWPLAVSTYLGGLVIAARQLYASKWVGKSGCNMGCCQPVPITKGESLLYSVAWPVWVPLRCLGKAMVAGWRLTLRGLFGDLP